MWDQKLTTPAGLYVVGLPLAAFGCTLESLRTINLLFGIGTLLLLRSILQELHPKNTLWESSMNSISIFLFPVSFFFHFLYYTDSGSTFFVLLSYYLSLRKNYLASAYTSGAAMLFRQTNVIWMMFICGNSVYQIIIFDPTTSDSKTIRSTALDLNHSCIIKA